MYCRKCLYNLQGLADAGQCPECGAYFDRRLPRTFLDELPKPKSRLGIFFAMVWVVLIAVGVAYVIQFMAAAQASGH
jgi:hypothetical protein